MSNTDGAERRKYEVVEVESSDDDEGHLFFNEPPKPKLLEIGQTLLSGTGGDTKMRTTANTAVSAEAGGNRSRKEILRAHIDNRILPKASVRVRGEGKKSKAKNKVPKHLPTDADYLYDGKERREAQRQSKVLGLSAADKEALLSQRVHQVLGETMDGRGKIDYGRFDTLKNPLGINDRLRPYLNKGSSLWKCAATNERSGSGHSAVSFLNDNSTQAFEESSRIESLSSDIGRFESLCEMEMNDVETAREADAISFCESYSNFTEARVAEESVAWEHDSIIAGVIENDGLNFCQKPNMVLEETVAWNKAGRFTSEEFGFGTEYNEEEMEKTDSLVSSKSKARSKIVLPKKRQPQHGTQNKVTSGGEFGFTRSTKSQTPPPRSPPANDESPLLNYSLIDTPVLKGELKRFGLKPLPRSKAKVILRHIYKETHPKH